MGAYDLAKQANAFTKSTSVPYRGDRFTTESRRLGGGCEGVTVDTNWSIRQDVQLMKLALSILLICMMSALSAPAVPEMDKLKSIYQTELTRLKSHWQGERLRLPLNHIAAMRDLEATYQQVGELKPLLAVRGERERFAANQSVDDIIPVAGPARLRVLQEAYIKDFKVLSTERVTRTFELREKYLRALVNLQKNLTRKGQIQSAVAVMNEVEARKKEFGVGNRDAVVGDGGLPTVPHTKPRSSRLDIDALNDLLHGEVMRWNSQNRQITITYDFSDGEQMEDWKSGERDAARGMLACERTVAWLRPELLQISEVKYDAFVDEERKQRAGMVVGDSLQAHLISGAVLQAKLFQVSEQRPITRFVETSRPLSRVHRSELSIQNDRIEWVVNHARARQAILQEPIRYPACVGFGHMESKSAYDNITITGILSKEYEAYLKQQL